MWSSLSDREQRLAKITAWLLSVALAFWLVITPAWTRREELGRLALKRRNELVGMQKDLRNQQDIEAEYERLAGAIQGTGSQDQERSKFTRSIDDLLTKHNLSVIDVIVLPEKDLSFCQILSLRINLKCRVSDIAALLDAIAGSAEPMKVEEMKLVCRSEIGQVDATLKITKVIINAAS